MSMANYTPVTVASARCKTGNLNLSWIVNQTDQYSSELSGIATCKFVMTRPARTKSYLYEISYYPKDLASPFGLEIGNKPKEFAHTIKYKEAEKDYIETALKALKEKYENDTKLANAADKILAKYEDEKTKTPKVSETVPKKASPPAQPPTGGNSSLSPPPHPTKPRTNRRRRSKSKTAAAATQTQNAKVRAEQKAAREQRKADELNKKKDAAKRARESRRQRLTDMKANVPKHPHHRTQSSGSAAVRSRGHRRHVSDVATTTPQDESLTSIPCWVSYKGWDEKIMDGRYSKGKYRKGTVSIDRGDGKGRSYNISFKTAVREDEEHLREEVGKLEFANKEIKFGTTGTWFRFKQLKKTQTKIDFIFKVLKTKIEIDEEGEEFEVDDGDEDLTIRFRKNDAKKVAKLLPLKKVKRGKYNQVNTGDMELKNVRDLLFGSRFRRHSIGGLRDLHQEAARTAGSMNGTASTGSSPGQAA